MLILSVQEKRRLSAQGFTKPFEKKTKKVEVFDVLLCFCVLKTSIFLCPLIQPRRMPIGVADEADQAWKAQKMASADPEVRVKTR